jgi:hypothetical protein
VIVDLINLDRFAARREEFMANNAHLGEIRAYVAFPPLAASNNDHGASTLRPQPHLAGA